MFERGYDRVLKAMKEDRVIVGYDCTGVDEMLGTNADHWVHVWVYEDWGHFVPQLRLETAMTEAELVKIIHEFKGQLWMHDDTDVYFSKMQIRYFSNNEPNTTHFFNPNAPVKED